MRRKRVSDVEDEMIEHKEAEEKREEQLMSHEGRPRGISNTIKWKTITIIGSQRKKRVGERDRSCR